MKTLREVTSAHDGKLIRIENNFVKDWESVGISIFYLSQIDRIASELKGQVNLIRVSNVNYRHVDVDKWALDIRMSFFKELFSKFSQALNTFYGEDKIDIDHFSRGNDGVSDILYVTKPVEDINPDDSFEDVFYQMNQKLDEFSKDLEEIARNFRAKNS